MSRFCLDTSAYSHFKRGDERVVEIIDGAEWIGMPAIVLGDRPRRSSSSRVSATPSNRIGRVL